MKHLFSLLVFLFSFNFLPAQSLPDYDEITLNKGEDYRTAESALLQAVDFLLNNPIDAEKLDRAKSLQFIIKWMQGTPDYTFNIDASTKRISDNLDLIGIYMAAMTKYCIQNPTKATSKEDVKINAWKILLAYCADEKNNVKPSKKIRKLIEANNNGTLEKELK